MKIINKSKNIYLFLIIGVVLTGFLIFIEKQSPAEENTNVNTIDWKTYQNQQIGLSLQYPSEWNIGSVYTELGGKRVDFNYYSGGPFAIEFSITRGASIYSTEKGRNVTFEEILADERKLADADVRSGISDFKETIISLDGYSAIKFSSISYHFRSEQYTYVTSIYEKTHNIAMHFFVHGYNKEEGDQEYSALLNSIIANFRFLD